MLLEREIEELDRLTDGAGLVIVLPVEGDDFEIPDRLVDCEAGPMPTFLIFFRLFCPSPADRRTCVPCRSGVYVGKLLRV